VESGKGRNPLLQLSCLLLPVLCPFPQAHARAECQLRSPIASPLLFLSPLPLTLSIFPTSCPVKVCILVFRKALSHCRWCSGHAHWFLRHANSRGSDYSMVRRCGNGRHSRSREKGPRRRTNRPSCRPAVGSPTLNATTLKHPHPSPHPTSHSPARAAEPCLGQERMQ